jgi:hypothetical protein
LAVPGFQSRQLFTRDALNPTTLINQVERLFTGDALNPRTLNPKTLNQVEQLFTGDGEEGRPFVPGRLPHQDQADEHDRTPYNILDHHQAF